MAMFSRPKAPAGAQTAHVLGGPGWNDVEVAGESHHRQAIAQLFHSWGLAEGGITMRTAALIPEPTNRYDKNAVMVVVDGSLVGYVPAEDAPRIKAQCARVPRGTVAACSVRIWAKNANGEWPARVTLAFSGSTERERDFAVEHAAERDEQRRYEVTGSVGSVRGASWVQQRSAVAELKRQGRLDEALALVDECAAASQRVGAALNERPDPWPAEQQSIILRKLKDPERELAALESYVSACGSFGVPDKIGDRLNRARVVLGVAANDLDEPVEVASAADVSESITEPAPPAPLPAAAWYPDPAIPATMRWWDGQRWTEHTAPQA